jgi:hypothetical protein
MPKPTVFYLLLLIAFVAYLEFARAPWRRLAEHARKHGYEKVLFASFMVAMLILLIVAIRALLRVEPWPDWITGPPPPEDLIYEKIRDSEPLLR